MGDIKRMFNPSRIALIGATERVGSVGRTILENLCSSHGRKVFPVNPNRNQVLGIKCYPDVASIGEEVELAVIAVHAEEVPHSLEDCAKAGIDGAIIVSTIHDGLGHDGEGLIKQIIEIRKRYGIRVIGPNCMGIIRPYIQLNTTPIEDKPEKGNVAFITESGGFGRVLLDWGIAAHIGFSMVASLGSMIDIDFGEVIDLLGEDPYTKSIIIYMEGEIGDVRRFVSATKGFVRNKPIILLKPIPPQQEDLAARTHSGALTSKERIYNALFKRVGVVRVERAQDLFNTASVLSSKRLPAGPRLLIITNTSGVGVMATNTLIELGGEPAALSEKGIASLRSLLSNGWAKDNFIYISRDAGVEVFTTCIEVGLKDPRVDAVLIIFSFQGAATSEGLAREVVKLAEGTCKPIIVTYMGGKSVSLGRNILLEHAIPDYHTPEEAVRTYMYMYSHKRGLELLYETPSELPIDQAPPKNHLRAFIARSKKEGQTVFTGEDALKFLKNYGMPTIKAHTVTTLEEAIVKVGGIGYPVALKVASPDIINKADTEVAITNITTEEGLRTNFERLVNKMAGRTDIRATGFIIQKVLEDIHYEVMLGAKRDPTFGTVILFGMGGTYARAFKDFSIGLPPLNQVLAKRLMEEARVYRILHGYMGRPPADLRQLEEIIVAFSNLIVDFPEIIEMDINPIAITHGKAFSLDARIVINKGLDLTSAAYPHLIITPYPSRYIIPWLLPDGTTILFRPIRPEDESMHHEMLATLTEETLRKRFFQTIKSITHEMLVRFCNIDYDREMAIIAEVNEAGTKRMIGIVRLITEVGTKKAEFAVLIHDSYHGKGLGYKLVDLIIGVAQDKGLEEIYGFVQTNNTKMLRLCKRLGFSIESAPEEMFRVSLLLR